MPKPINPTQRAGDAMILLRWVKLEVDTDLSLDAILDLCTTSK